MKRVIGIILLVLGLFFVYQGYEEKQSFGAKAERTIGNLVNIDEKKNSDANIKLIVGGIAAVAGIILIVAGAEKKKII